MISIDQIHKSHGRRQVLHGVSFEARAGRVTAFLGPNGAGKSSTLRILLGLDRPASGRAVFDGVRYRDLENPLTTVGAMFDGPGASPGRSARNHLRWMCHSNGIPVGRVPEVLERVGLSGNAKDKVGTFSLGMGQRLGIASALLGAPATLVLDEPTNGLDPDGLRWLRGFLTDQAAAGRTVLVSSHLIDEMEEVADDVVVIDDGYIVATGTVAAVRHTHASLQDAFFTLTDAGRRRVGGDA